MTGMPRALRLLAAGYALAVYAFIFLPVVVLVLFSFQGSRFPVPPFTGPSLRWYEAVLSDRNLTAGLINSIAVAVLSSLLAALLGFLAAYGFARFRLPAGATLRALVTAPLMVSYLIIGMGLLILFNRAGVGQSLSAAGIGQEPDTRGRTRARHEQGSRGILHSTLQIAVRDPLSFIFDRDPVLKSPGGLAEDIRDRSIVF